MSKEKQIDSGDCKNCNSHEKQQIKELARALMKAINEKHGHISMRVLAEALYNAGYRKQSENTVEVVRCKDCEHYGLNSPIVKNKHCLYFSGYDEIFTEPNDYCSFAKMKGGAE